MYMLLDTPWPNQQRQTFDYSCGLWVVGFVNFTSKVSILRFLRLPDHVFAACSLLYFHSILASNHDFAVRSPIDFAV